MLSTRLGRLFLDEGVDIEVLQQLKKTWETKIQASGAVDLEGRRTPVAPPHLAARQSRQQLPSTPNNIVPKGTTLAQPPPLPENIAGTSQPHAQQQQPSQTFMNSQNPVQLLSLPAQMLASTSGMQFQSGIIPGTQYAIVDGPNGAPSLVLLNPQVQLSLETQAQFLLQQPNSGNPIIRHPTPNIATKKEPKNVPQLDGGASSPQKNNAKQTANKEGIKKNSNKTVTQLDGGGPGMTDSSSEEEQEAEHSLNRYAGLEDDESAEKAEEVEEEEEEPLNSDDDQSDDEDLETLFDADNIVVCQFEKVHRARNKWKFILKDGVMQVKGKDYCFHKGVGEAEW